MASFKRLPRPTQLCDTARLAGHGTQGVSRGTRDVQEEAKLDTLQLVMARKGISILCTQETHELGSQYHITTQGYPLINSGHVQAEGAESTGEWVSYLRRGCGPCWDSVKKIIVWRR